MAARPDVMDTLEAATYLGVHPGTLINWRYYKRGPRFKREGRLVRYAREELDRFKGVKK